MSAHDPSSAAFFEHMYRQDADPWRFAENPAELSRYDATLAALAGRCFWRACEPGCSVGVLTEKLARVCAQVDAFDFSETAVAQARARCAGLPQVTVRCAAFPAGLELGGVDLLVLSEIGYYFAPDAWRQIVAETVERLEAGATVLAVHWLGHSPDHQMHGDEVHEILAAAPGLRHVSGERYATFRIDSWVKR